MANILQGLGQSNAIPDYLQGVTKLRQQALQEKQGEQALQLNDINLAKGKLDLAEAQKKEQYMNMTSDPNMSPAFAWMKPEQKQEWIDKLVSAGYAKKVGDTGAYVWTNRDKLNAMQMFTSSAEMVKLISGQRLTNSQNELMGLQQQLSQAQEKGKPEEIQKIQQQYNSKLQEYNLLLGHVEPSINAAKFNESLNNFQQSNPEQYNALMSNNNFSMAINMARNTGDAKVIESVYKMIEEGAKPKQMDEFHTFQSGPEGRATVAAYEKATTKPVDSTARDEKLHSQLLAQSNSDAWKKTQLRFPKSGMSFNFNTAEVNTGSGGDPAAVNFFEQERNKAVTARLRKVGLYNKYGDLYQTTTEPAAKFKDPTKISGDAFYKEISAQGSESKGKSYLMNTYGYPEKQAEDIIRNGIKGGWIK